MGFKLDRSSPVPLYAQIEAYLRELIRDEKYITGETNLPDEIGLSKKFGVSRNTLRQAINKLTFEGLLERKKGIGTRVVTQKITTRLDNWISFTKEMRAHGIEVVNYLVNISFVIAKPDVCAALEVPENSKVWKLEKIRGSKTTKFLYSVSFFHPRIGINSNANFNLPLYDLLEQEYNIIVARSSEKLKAIEAGASISKLLDVKEGIPILKRERLVYDVGEKPVEFNKVFYLTDYFTYNVDIKRNL